MGDTSLNLKSINSMSKGFLLILFTFIFGDPTQASKDSLFPDDIKDSQSLSMQLDSLNSYFLTTFKPSLHVVDLQISPESNLVKGAYQFLTPSELKSILDSNKLKSYEKEILEEFFKRLAVEYKSGLFFLTDMERERLYKYPTEVRKDYKKIRSSRNLIDLWDINSRKYSEGLDLYVHERDRYLHTPAPLLTAQNFSVIDKKLIVRVLKKKKSASIDPASTQEELIDAWNSSNYDPAPNSNYYSEIIVVSGSSAVKSIESPLYRRKSVFFSPYENELVNKIFERLKSTLDKDKSSLIKDVPLVVENSDYLILRSTTNKTIEISSTLMRAGFSVCANYAYNVVNLHKRNQRTNPIYYDRNAGHNKLFYEYEDLQILPDQDRNDLFGVMYIYNPENEKISFLLRTEGYVRDGDLEEGLIKYKSCLIEAFSFSIAHELAHLYLGAKIEDVFQPNPDEYLADCNAYNHVISTFGFVSEKDIFFRVYESMYDQREFRYFKSSVRSNDFKRRSEVIKNLLTRDSLVVCK